jgi:hypothetical protein
MKTWYLVINDGCVVVKSEEKAVAEQYADEMNDTGAEESADEYGYESGSPESYYQNGYDGGFHEVERVKVPRGADENMEIDAGSYSFTVEDINSAPEIDEQYFW